MNRPGKPLVERSYAEIVALFLVCPALAGIGIIIYTILYAVHHHHELSLLDWFFQVGWFGVFGFLLMTVLPVIGWNEMQRRR